MARSSTTTYLHTCDRCGIEVTTDQMTVPHWRLLFLSSGMWRTREDDQGEEWELCDRCVQMLHAWASTT